MGQLAGSSLVSREDVPEALEGSLHNMLPMVACITGPFYPLSSVPQINVLQHVQELNNKRRI
jgi:hypothetical protein